MNAGGVVGFASGGLQSLTNRYVGNLHAAACVAHMGKVGNPVAIIVGAVGKFAALTLSHLHAKIGLILRGLLANFLMYRTFSLRFGRHVFDRLFTKPIFELFEVQAARADGHGFAAKPVILAMGRRTKFCRFEFRGDGKALRWTVRADTVPENVLGTGPPLPRAFGSIIAPGRDFAAMNRIVQTSRDVKAMRTGRGSAPVDLTIKKDVGTRYVAAGR